MMFYDFCSFNAVLGGLAKESKSLEKKNCTTTHTAKETVAHTHPRPSDGHSAWHRFPSLSPSGQQKLRRLLFFLPFPPLLFLHNKKIDPRNSGGWRTCTHGQTHRHTHDGAARETWTEVGSKISRSVPGLELVLTDELVSE
uniref:(northern house mosquito) hypothetical protein n=1 Tax=Culex pipiens TaxID=7175 RepID=A0A8D8DGP1_CULPI